MDDQTPADTVAHEQARLRAAMWWALPAFGFGFLGLAIGFDGYGMENSVLRRIGFGFGTAGVLLGAVAAWRTRWVMLPRPSAPGR